MKKSANIGLVALLLAAHPSFAQLPVASAVEDVAQESAAPAEGDDQGGRIIGGTSAVLGDVPWQVQVYWKDPGADDPQRPAWQRAHRCGGALITPEWVLTAAHCFFSNDGKTAYPASDFAVRVGLVSIQTPPAGANRAIRPGGLFIHPGYIPCRSCTPARAGTRPLSDAHKFLFTHDIALIRLAQPVAPNRIHRPIARNEQSVTRSTALASGWGAASNPDKREFRFQPVLQKVDVAVVPCGPEEGFLPTHVCAGGTAGKDTCVGDSGGPLAVFTPAGARLVGITSRRPSGEANCGGSATRATPETRYSSLVGDNYAWISTVLATNGTGW